MHRHVIAVALMTVCGCGAPTSPTAPTSPPAPPAPTATFGLSVEVCLREKLPSVNYPHAGFSSTVGISMSAFGIAPGLPVEDWRRKTVGELADTFAQYVAANNIPVAQRYMLDFEKDYTSVDPDNREGIERSIAAVRSVMPGATILLYGTPFPHRQSGRLESAFSDPDYLQWVSSLDVGFVPVLYISGVDGGTTFPSLEVIRTRAEESLSVLPPGQSTPYLWHKWRNGGNAQTNPNIIDEYPNLEPLRVQLEVAERLGISNVCFWHSEDDPAIAEALEILFG